MHERAETGSSKAAQDGGAFSSLRPASFLRELLRGTPKSVRSSDPSPVAGSTRESPSRGAVEEVFLLEQVPRSPELLEERSLRRLTGGPLWLARMEILITNPPRCPRQGWNRGQPVFEKTEAPATSRRSDRDPVRSTSPDPSFRTSASRPSEEASSANELQPSRALCDHPRSLSRASVEPGGGCSLPPNIWTSERPDA